MIQKDLLLPYKTVYDNIALPLVIQNKDKKYIRNKIESKLKTFRLDGSENNWPNYQVARDKERLLRTFMFSDKIVLLDEPFSALDYFTKHEMYDWALNIKDKMCLTTLIISHDIDEVVYLCDRVYVLMGRPATIRKIVQIDKNNLDIHKKYIWYF